MRYLIKTIKIIALICGLLLLTLIIVNWGDEELKPEVVQALAWKPPTNAFADNGYLILLGIEAPIEMDAAQLGKKALEAQLSRFAAVQKTHIESPAPEQNPAEVDDYIDWKDNRCKYSAQPNCVDFYLQQGADKLIFVLLAQERLAARFQAIKQSKSYVEVMPPLVTAEFPKYSILMQASEMERIQAILDISEGKLEQGVARFAENASFSRRLLRESTSLVSHMVALAMVQRDTRILSELMVKYPKIATQYAAQLVPVLAPISAPEYNLKKAFVNEKSMILTIINHSNNLLENEAFTSELRRLPASFDKLAYQPNATLNMLYDWAQYRIKLAEVSAADLDSAKQDLKRNQQTLLGLGIHPYYIKNPMGKILVSVAEPDYYNYIERQHDLDGYIYMVNFQLIAILNKLEIKKLGLHDPYKNLMQYDANSGVLTFAGRQPASGNFNESNIYQVKLH